MIELHCHTRVSDGYYNVEETIKLAKEKDIEYMAITDHDTTSGTEEAIKCGEKYGVNIIHGIEISGYDFYNNKKAHILGYHVNYEDNYLNDFCKDLRERRLEAAKKMIDIINEAGYNLSLEEVKKYAQDSTGIFKQHIMHALIHKGYTDKIYSDLYYKLFSSNPKDRGFAFVPLKYIDAVEAVKVVKKANGIAVLAHPALSDCFEIIPKLVKAGLDGIEAKHTHQKAHEEKMIQSIAKYYNLILTGGSDFHGFYGYMDESLGSCSPGIETIEKFNDLLEKKSIVHSVKA